jgi:hypothetical protein
MKIKKKIAILAKLIEESQKQITKEKRNIKQRQSKIKRLMEVKNEQKS